VGEPPTEEGSVGSVETPLWDTHAHLTDPRLEPIWREILDNARAAGVHGVINIGTDLNSCRKALLQAEGIPERMRVTVGLHPHEAGRITPEDLRTLKEMTRSRHVVAVGEIGLDYHHMRSGKDDQIAAFRLQLEAAVESDLPVVVHSRDAEGDVVEMIGEFRDRLKGGVLHCYTGGLAEAKMALELGLYVSFTGIVTFGDGSLDGLVRYVPLDRLLLETDSPYLAPVPYRGKINTPAYLPVIARRIAGIKSIDYDEVVGIASRNAGRLFGLTVTPDS